MDHEIEIVLLDEDDKVWKYEVCVIDEDSETFHDVTLDKEYYENLDTVTPPKEIIRKSFLFLLKKEKKEDILAQFNLEKIGKYFPEFKKEVEKF